MAKQIFGYGGINRESKKQFVGYGGTNREVQKRYRGINGANVLIYTASEVELLLHAEDYTDSNTPPKTITNVGTTINPAGKFNSAFAFASASYQYLKCTDSTLGKFGMGDFTIDLWACPYTNTNFMGIVGTTTGQAWELSPDSFTLRVVAGKPGVTYKIAAGSTDAERVEIYSDTAIANNVFTHLAFVRYNQEFTIYANGISIFKTTINYPMNMYGLMLGCIDDRGDLGPDAYFNGKIDEVRISAKAEWTANFTPPTMPYGESLPPSTDLVLVDGNYVNPIIGGFNNSNITDAAGGYYNYIPATLTSTGFTYTRSSFPEGGYILNNNAVNFTGYNYIEVDFEHTTNNTNSTTPNSFFMIKIYSELPAQWDSTDRELAFLYQVFISKSRNAVRFDLGNAKNKSGYIMILGLSQYSSYTESFKLYSIKLIK